MPRGDNLKGWWKGKKRPLSTRIKMSKATEERWASGSFDGSLVGENHHNWQGDNVNYRNLHRWVVAWLGQPDKCEQCGRGGLTGHEIHWANKSHQYKRNLSDWIRLCVGCHKAYDQVENAVATS